jgi:fluoroacetyl-CoA thioesterase
MMELACVHGMLPFLDWPREQSLGPMVNFQHLASTPPGMTLRIEGEVIEVDGPRVRFKVQAWDEQERICEGTHERCVIDRDRFNGRVAKKRRTAIV